MVEVPKKKVAPVVAPPEEGAPVKRKVGRTKGSAHQNFAENPTRMRAREIYRATEPRPIQSAIVAALLAEGHGLVKHATISNWKQVDNWEAPATPFEVTVHKAIMTIGGLKSSPTEAVLETASARLIELSANIVRLIEGQLPSIKISNAQDLEIVTRCARDCLVTSVQGMRLAAEIRNMQTNASFNGIPGTGEIIPPENTGSSSPIDRTADAIEAFERLN